MAGNIKGITIEFSANTNELDRAIKNTEKETAKIDQELKKVNQALKFNPGSVDLLRQKQTLLNQKIQETTAKLESLKQKQAALDAKGVDKNSKEYRELQREIIATESRLKTFKGQLQSIGNVKLRAASVQLKEIGSKATAAGHAMAGVSRAAALVTGAITALTVKSAKWADNLNTLSKQYSVGTRELQIYSAAAKLVDVDVQDVLKSQVKLTRNMSSAARGSERQADAFKALGVEYQNADGTLKDSEQVFQEVITALGKIKNETQRNAIAMDLFGRSAAQINPLIEDGGETYKRVAETMKKYGLDFLDQKTIDKANKFNDQLDTMRAIGMLAFQSLGAELATVLEPVLARAADAVGRFAQWLSQLNPTVLAVIAGISGFVAILAPALLLFGALATAAGAVAGVLAGISAPMVAVAAGIAAFIAVVATAAAKSEPFRDAIANLGASLAKVFLPVIREVVSVAKQLFTIIGETVTEIANDLAPVLNILTPIFTKVAQVIATVLIARLKNIIQTVKLVAAVVKILVKGFATAFTSIVAKASAFYSKLKSTFNRVKSAMTGPFEAAKNRIKSIVDSIKGFFNGIRISPPHIPLPHFSVSPAGWDIGDLVKGKIPSLSVKWYAKGGIFNSPTLAGIGEAGPEAVIPLDTLWKKLDAIAASNGGNTFNIYGGPGMDAKAIARAVEDVLIQQQKQRLKAWGY